MGHRNTRSARTVQPARPWPRRPRRPAPTTQITPSSSPVTRGRSHVGAAFALVSGLTPVEAADSPQPTSLTPDLRCRRLGDKAIPAVWNCLAGCIGRTGIAMPPSRPQPGRGRETSRCLDHTNESPTASSHRCACTAPPSQSPASYTRACTSRYMRERLGFVFR